MSKVLVVILAGLVIIVVSLSLVIFPVLAFVDCIRNRELTAQSKIAWGCLILFTWTLGAAIYGIVASKRPFYRRMGILCACLIFAALIAKKPLERYQEKQKADIEASKQSLHAQLKTTYAAEWDRYKPIYVNFGMTDVWSAYQSGQCQEGKSLLNSNWPRYQKVVAKALGGENGTDFYHDMAVKGFDLCERIKKDTQTP